MLLAPSRAGDDDAFVRFNHALVAGLETSEGAEALRGAFAIDSLHHSPSVEGFLNRWCPTDLREGVEPEARHVLQPVLASGVGVGNRALRLPAAGVTKPLTAESELTFMPNAPAAVRGTMSALLPEAAFLSPAVGLAFCAGGSSLLRRLYDFKPVDTRRGLGAASAAIVDGGVNTIGDGSLCGALSQQLFYRNHLEEPLRPTTNLSGVAPHLSASLVACVLGLVWRRAAAAEVLEALRRAVCNETGLTLPERPRGTVPTLARFQSFVALVAAADEEEGAPLPRTGTTLVLHHLWLRSSSRRDLWTYLTTLHDEFGPVLRADGSSGDTDEECGPRHWWRQPPFARSDLDPPKLAAAAELLFASKGSVSAAADGDAAAVAAEASKAAATAFETLAAGLAQEGSRTGNPLMMGKFGFGGGLPKADCTEVCIRELLCTLLWCPSTRAFDRERLPVSCSAPLREFFAEGGPADCQQHAHLRPAEAPPSYAAAWYRALSNLPSVLYLAGSDGCRYEASPTVENVAASLSCLLGLSPITRSLEELQAAWPALAAHGLRISTNDRRDRLYVSGVDTTTAERDGDGDRAIIVEFVFSPPPDGLNHAFAIHRHVRPPWQAKAAKLALKHWKNAWWTLHPSASLFPRAHLLPALLQPFVAPTDSPATSLSEQSAAPRSPIKSEWLWFWLRGYHEDFEQPAANAAPKLRY